MKVTLTVSVDVTSALEEAVSNVQLSGLGADGTSEYEISDVSVTENGDGTYDLEVYCDRLEGKFASKDEVADAIAGELSSLDVGVSL